MQPIESNDDKHYCQPAIRDREGDKRTPEGGARPATRPAPQGGPCAARRRPRPQGAASHPRALGRGTADLHAGDGGESRRPPAGDLRDGRRRLPRRVRRHDNRRQHPLHVDVRAPHGSLQGDGARGVHPEPGEPHRHRPLKDFEGRHAVREAAADPGSA